MPLYIVATEGPVPEHAVEVYVCSEDGAVYGPGFQCPACMLRPDTRWGD